MDKIDRKFHPVMLYSFTVHVSKHQTEKPGLMQILFSGEQMQAQAGQGMISGKGKHPHNHLVVNVKNSSTKYCFYIYIWYNYYTIFRKRRQESVLKQQREELFQTKMVTVILYAHCIYNILLKYELPIL